MTTLPSFCSGWKTLIGNPNVERTGNVIIVNIQLELTAGINHIHRIIAYIHIPVDRIRVPKLLPTGSCCAHLPNAGL